MGLPGSSETASRSCPRPGDSNLSPRLLSPCSYNALARSFCTASSVAEVQEDSPRAAAATRTPRAARLHPLDRVILCMLSVDFVPTYEYECPRCPRVFEVRQRISEPALTTCDRCGGPIRRLLSPAPFILKGGGWYVTDYPSEARKKALSSESSEKSSSSSSTDGKSSTSSETPSSTSSSSSSSSSSGSEKSSSGSEKTDKTPKATGGS